ncbi:SLC45 family MFS transporter [Hujiaoplasma nucleasis]|uniref:SLC45 family MFS transporter n=1 Tax=Hujiaoplasma nucleasis TaxID=2725268 RepID=A0A7L6N293_9MOLU|nr:MFS transporter [Hujiaoplasma nucleasis]QLY40376.1 SLC45 family MFS transporter [Hujiaoplasma nucleasis]
MKFNVKKTIYVGLAFLMISMFWSLYDSLIGKILIDKFGLNQLWSGVVMALDNMLALFLIPVFGALSDKSNHKKGRRTPFIVVGTVVAAFAFMSLTFSDNVQKSKIEAESQIIEDYDVIYRTNADLELKKDFDEEDRLLIFSNWQGIQSNIENEWQKLRDESVISADEYAEYERDIIQPMDQILSDNQITDTEGDELREIFNHHANERAKVITLNSPGTFIVFLLTLFVALLAMQSFRSPAVALMPDVTVKPLRSKANAIINLMGTIGALIAITTTMVYGLSQHSFVNYTPAFITVGVIMLIILGIFLWKVKEPELVAERLANEVKYGIVDEDPDHKDLSHEEKAELSRSKKISLILILVSVTLWFFGYNAVTTKLSDYAPKVLLMGFAIPNYIAYGSAALAFIPIGILATKIGRKKTILMGIVLLTICFGSVYFLTPDTSFIMYIIFAFTGIAWATINVNSYPMVVELSNESNVGKYTGYYYTFSMAAQIITPVFSGFLMDQFGRKILFPYAATFVAIAFVTMFFVKHGDVKIPKKGSLLENFDVDMD